MYSKIIIFQKSIEIIYIIYIAIIIIQLLTFKSLLKKYFMVRVILVKRAESGKYWRMGLPLDPGTSPGAARGGGHPVSAVMGRRGGVGPREGAPRAR